MTKNKAFISLSLIQMDIAWENEEKNLSRINEKLKEIPEETEIIILPEMFSTGFTMNVQNITKPVGKQAFEWMKNTSHEIGKILVGSILTEEKGHFYNRMFWMRPDGTFDYYDKRHLFHMGGEHKVMTAGKNRKIIQYKGVKFMLQICYDLRFPVWSKNQYDKENDLYEYDVLIFIANWPESRKQAYLNLLKARAIENQSYVIWVNRVGKDGKNIEHSGDTQVISPSGKLLWKTIPKKEQILNVEITHEIVKNLREKFKVGLDWDDFVIKF